MSSEDDIFVFLRSHSRMNILEPEILTGLYSFNLFLKLVILLCKCFRLCFTNVLVFDHINALERTDNRQGIS